MWKPTLEIPWVLAGVAGVQYDEVGGGGWGRCGGRAGVKDSLRAVTRGPPSPLSRTSPTPKAGPDRQAAAILNGLSQNRPIYLEFFLNLSQIPISILNLCYWHTYHHQGSLVKWGRSRGYKNNNGNGRTDFIHYVRNSRQGTSRQKISIATHCWMSLSSPLAAKG